MTAEWFPNCDICDILHQKRGNLASVAKHFGIHRYTLYRYIAKNPEIQKHVDEAREFHSIDEIDLAVSLNYKFMQDYENNAALASRHAIYTLDKKGHSRGYLKDASDLSLNKDIESKFDESMAHVLSLISPARNMDDNSISNET
jgi:hypothetical protein